MSKVSSYAQLANQLPSMVNVAAAIDSNAGAGQQAAQQAAPQYPVLLSLSRQNSFSCST